MYDIIFFALLAAYIGYKLYKSFGRTDNDNSADIIRKYLKDQIEMDKEKSNIFAFPKAEKMQDVTPPPAAPSVLPSDVQSVINQIHYYDRSFTYDFFITGAKKAFEYILASYAKGDKEALRPLLSDDVYKNFTQEIDRRTAAGETLQTTLVSIISCQIVSGKIDKTEAFLEVKYISEQINRITENSANSGDNEASADNIERLEDGWVFARNVESGNPNWRLVETRQG